MVIKKQLQPGQVIELLFTAIDFRFTEGVEGKLSGSERNTVLNSTKYCPLKG